MNYESDYKIYNMDAYEQIKNFEKHFKVNHIITDPPYNISQKNNFNTMKSAKRMGVDFGDWDKNFDLYGWIPLYGNFIDKNGSFIIFTSYRYISHIVDVLESSGFVVKDVIKWQKSNPMPRNVTRRYVQDTEFAVWAVKQSGKWVFNKPDDTPYLRAEIKTSTVSGHERTKHPTQKSRKLMSEIIKIHTNKNDIILDPFMGTGTTGVAALENGRKFIGIEISKEYFEIARERLTNEKSNVKLFIE